MAIAASTSWYGLSSCRRQASPGNGDDGDHEWRLGEQRAHYTRASSSSRPLVLDDDEPETVAGSPPSAPGGRPQWTLSSCSSGTGIGLVAAYSVAGGDRLEEVHGPSLGMRHASVQA
jgi:hypothetical protein